MQENNNSSNQNEPKNFFQFVIGHKAIKMFVVLGLFLFMLVLLFITAIFVQGREEYKRHILYNVSTNWGNAQKFYGPVIAIPVKQGADIATNSGPYLFISPDKLKIEGEISPQIIKKDFFQFVGYSTNFKIDGEFSDILGKIQDIVHIPVNSLMLDKSLLLIGVNDYKGIPTIPLYSSGVIGGKSELQRIDGLRTVSVYSTLASGNNFYTKIDLTKPLKKDFNFSTKFILRGINSVELSPTGQENKVYLSSSWTKPNFDDYVMPTKSNISKKGFNAEWVYSNFSSNNPTVWFGSSFYANTQTIGLTLLNPYECYRNTMELIKYGIIIIALAFLALFIQELTRKWRIHLFQYTLIGIAMVLYYLLLLSLSEFLDFYIAYIIASIFIVILISYYTYSTIIRENNRFTFASILGISSLLYIFQYLLLNFKNLSMMFMTINLFIVLIIVMFITKNINSNTDK